MKSQMEELVWECREESDMDRKVALYNLIRKFLPNPPKMPSMVTDDYINSALDDI
jgi:hypothetical protein